MRPKDFLFSVPICIIAVDLKTGSIEYQALQDCI